MSRYNVTVELNDFGITDRNYTERELRAEFLKTLKADLESIDGYLKDDTVIIKLKKLKDVPVSRFAGVYKP